MPSKYGFTSMTATEFETWIAGTSVTRTIKYVQHHHTWAPNYSHFANHDAFTLQKNMKHHHVGTNGWSDIGQHFSIFPDGAILTGRPLNRAPACIYGNNKSAICIESVGDFDLGQDQMTTAQRNSILRVTAALLNRFSLVRKDEHGIVYHHWFDLNSGARTNGSGTTKSCPGTGYFGGNTVAAFRANLLPDVLALLGGGPVPPPHVATIAGILRYVVVTASALNIRTGPGSNHPKITEHGPAEMGSVLRVFDEQSGWLKVSASKEHWVYGRYTHLVRPGEVNTVDSNCRSGPGTTFGIVNVYQPGDDVFVHDTQGSWSNIGVDQWVHSSLITLV